MKLVIVESPSKTKTIKQYLGSDYDVVASKGHIRDIKNTGLGNLGLDLSNGYKPIYETIDHQVKTVSQLKGYASKADEIYLATDPDREGEAISWHLEEVLKSETEGKIVKRIEFNEITEPAVTQAILNPRDVDLKLVSAQETRKIMDRVIGYKLSPILQKYVGSGGLGYASAGRVQSAALKMIYEKELEVLAFVPKKYYEIYAEFDGFKAKLMDGSKAKQFETFEEAEKVLNELTNEFKVSSIDISNRAEKPQPPFVTSTLYQAALSKYGMSSKKTAQVATTLYQGVEIGGKHVALITYIRTDSARLSDVFKGQLSGYIVNTFGSDYLGYLHERKQTENVQDAHEAIRPVSLLKTPKSLANDLNPDQLKIYELIYNQTVESMMKDALIEVKKVSLLNNNYRFETQFERTVFAGFKKNRGYEDKPIIPMNLGDIFESNAKLDSKETEGPKRYTESTLIKAMETAGIGRPSTYVSTIETLKTRKYVSIVKKYFQITELGTYTIKFLIKYYDNFINVDYTAAMETKLDEIADGTALEFDAVDNFYLNFMEWLKNNKPGPIETGEVCPNCGHNIVLRVNRGGFFKACSNYPECKYIIKEEVEEPKETIEIECPECHKGHLVERISKYGSKAGKKFYGCSNYPECKFTISKLPIKK